VLLELRVENYAVIENVVVEFAPGLNLLTGETGAGKSLLIDALALLLGEKASADVVRQGAEKAVVSGVFEAAGKALMEILESHGLEPAEEGSVVIVRREVAAGGKGRVFVNNQPATVAVLRRLAPHLATIHAQNETMQAFDEAARLALLDSFAGADRGPAATAYAAWDGVRQHIAALQRDEQERLRLLDVWQFQAREIAEARLAPGEDQRLENEKRVLANAEKIYGAAMAAYGLLYENEASAAAALRGAARQVEEVARYEPRFREAAEALESARITAEDAATTLRDYAGGVQSAPQRLAEVEDRLALLDRLKRKYGPKLEEVIAAGAGLERRLHEIENKDEVLRELRKQLALAADAYLAEARRLSQQRRAAARKLEKQVEAEINDLAMKATFRVAVQAEEGEQQWTAAGLDRASYLISPNPGEPLKPVEQIASGGELSRVMLALKATVESGGAKAGWRAARGAVQRTMVFDEIDSGIGGRAAEAVGRRLKSLARANQVLCVTHLAQIASFADQHYAIEKAESRGRTRITVRALPPAERAEELARMLSGAVLTEASRKHASQMLKANA
jgi:DNA repair protein RecN (Recombination protein N)